MPLTRGAYSHIRPGASAADADRLGEPAGGRILVAGEHTRSARLAYADGALTSGIREARRLLGTRPDDSPRRRPAAAAKLRRTTDRRR